MKPVQLPSFMSIGATAIELREFNNAKMKKYKMQKLYLAIIVADSVHCVKYLVHNLVLKWSML